VQRETPADVEDRLANLQALTDTALNRLDVDDLLVELLDRVREILDADTAAVLLLDTVSGQLVARAACGIEEEVRQGVRVPLGAGFAGRIAASKGAIRLDHVDETTVTNPILWEKGIKVMLGVPLLSGESVLGVLHVGRLVDRPFGPQDVDLLQVVAERVAGAIQTRLLAIERAAAGLLERSLLPGTLPSCPGLEFAARYAPAEARTVGGDWYDLFTVPSGQLWIVAGDVAGHGLEAAVVMGRIRSALRAYTLLDVPPDTVLDLVGRKVDHFEIGTIATVACAVTESPFDSVTLAVAGHPPPIVAAPGRPTEFAPVDVGPPLGMGFAVPRTSTTVALAPGAVMAFYTDGLVERRGESIEVGLERLRATIRPVSPDRVAREVMHQLLADIVPADDIALVIIRRTNARDASGCEDTEVVSPTDARPR
jgi:sigma-B regulation protein RsbU (phosphoserine phosphatase)